jgi:hypothetical protein
VSKEGNHDGKGAFKIKHEQTKEDVHLLKESMRDSERSLNSFRYF